LVELDQIFLLNEQNKTRQKKIAPSGRVAVQRAGAMIHGKTKRRRPYFDRFDVTRAYIFIILILTQPSIFTFVLNSFESYRYVGRAK
jgi:hypothetical protein